MKLLKQFSLIVFLFFILGNSIFAINEVVVRVPDIYLSRPGFIDKATLVVEPFGSYSEQSLYLEYSDHDQFHQGQKVEIIHRFELPQGSVVNDLWLWIGDSVMKAICIDTWTARSIYDSIVSMKRDPAFLTKKGNQYELHIYPLEPGNFRKIKMNFITPIRLTGNKANVELPFLMLRSDNNIVKPLEVLFRTKQNIWGDPGFIEAPTQTFTALSDTSGYHYKRSYLNDISQFSSLKLSFYMDVINGVYFNSEKSTDSLTYFQSSFQLKEIFNPEIDSSSKKNLIGIDLSGSSNKNYSTLIPNLKRLFKAELKPNDLFNLIVSGTGSTNKLSSDWITAAPANIDNVLNSFMQSNFGDSINISKLPTLTYCDTRAPICWGFTGVESFANLKKYDNIYLASGAFNNSDIIASYDQGNERIPSAKELPVIIACLDSFFQKGGRFLTYYDLNRDMRGEPVATHYINGLHTKSQIKTAITLYRSTYGNIATDFPESIEHTGTYTLSYEDQGVSVELKDKEGNPVVISKRIGNGLIVVSGIWSFNDDAPLRKLLGMPLLGLNHTKAPSQLEQTLNALSNEYAKEPFDKALIISNSDSLILAQDAVRWADNYTARFTNSSRPVYNSINLLDGSTIVPSSVTVNGVSYYGSGYLMKKISDNMKGIHFETSMYDWDLISSMLSPYSIPALEQLNLEAFTDNKPDKIQDIREIKQEPQDNNSPRFFIGSAKDVGSEIRFNLTARFNGIDSLLKKSFTLKLNNETSQLSQVLPLMMGYETIKGYFASGGKDTAKIVKLALKHNILCDYTALLALEPNDTNHFIKDPKVDERPPATLLEAELKSDSSGFSVFPNPFNSQTKILIKVKSPARLNLYIFNILGQLVRTIAEGEELLKGKFYVWNGRDAWNQPVSSGIYFLRVELKEKDTNKDQIFTRKLLLLK